MITHTIPAHRFLQALGIVAEVLGDKERPVAAVRKALADKGFFTSLEISMIFDSLRNERVRGIGVTVRANNGVHYWKLKGEYKS